MTKMTKREKMLVVVLVLTAIAVCGFMFVIKPVMEARAENQLQIQEKEAQKKALEDQVLRFNAVKAELETATAVVEDNSKLFYPEMYNWEAERIVTSVLNKHEIDIQSVAIADPTVYQLPAVNTVDENGNTVEGSVTPTSLNVISVAVTFRSNFDQLKDYLDEISRIKRKTVITGWTYSAKAEEGQPTDTLEGSFVINLYTAPAEEEITQEQAAE